MSDSAQRRPKEIYNEMCQRFNIKRFEEDFLKLGEYRSSEEAKVVTTGNSSTVTLLSSTTRSLVDYEDDDPIYDAVPVEKGLIEGNNLYDDERKKMGDAGANAKSNLRDKNFKRISGWKFDEDRCGGDTVGGSSVQSFSDEVKEELAYLKATNGVLGDSIEKTIKDNSSEADSVITGIKNGDFPEIDVLKESILELFALAEEEKESLKAKIKTPDPKYLEFAVKTLCENEKLKKEKAIALAAKDSELLTKEEQVKKRACLDKVGGEINDTSGLVFLEKTELSQLKRGLEELHGHLEVETQIMSAKESWYQALQLSSENKLNKYKKQVKGLSKENAYLKKLLYTFGKKMESFVDDFAQSEEECQN